MTINHTNSGRARIGRAEVKASFHAPNGEPFCLAYFGRPLANLVTPMLFNAGMTADQAVLIRAGVNTAALGLLVIGTPTAVIAGVALYFVANVLDCVDGNLSRLWDVGSFWGKFIDGLVDEMLVRLAPFAAGLGLWLNGGPGAALAIGGAVTAIALFTSMTRQRYSFGREWMTATTGPLTDTDSAHIAGCERISGKAVSVITNVDYFAPVIMLVPGGVWYYLLFMVAVESTANLIWLIMLLRQAHLVLRRRRKAVHLGTPAQTHK